MVEWISHLTIKGFKSIRLLDSLELRRFNVLIGANGAGKSNLIDFFRMLNFAFGSTTGNLGGYVATEGGAGSLLYYGSQETRFIDASIRFEREDRWSRYDFSLSWGAPDDLFYSNELLAYQRKTDERPVQLQLRGGSRESEVLSTADRVNDRFRREAQGFRDSLRRIRAYHFHDTSDRAYIRTTQDLQRDRYLMANGGNLAAFLHALRDDFPDHYRRILRTVQLIAPFIMDFVLEPEAENRRSVLLRWMDRSGTIFGPHQLSDGTLRAIALITALMQPDALMPSILIFDEPELGLHPAAISVVADLLKTVSLKRQVIAATQSTLLIRSYMPEDVIVIEREEIDGDRGQTVIHSLAPEGLEPWLQDYDLGQLYEKNVTGGGPQ